MAANEYQNPAHRQPQGKVAGILEVDTATAITVQLKALSMKIDSLANYGVNQITSVCELCAGSHATEQCAISSDSAQFMSNVQRSQQPVPATYHPDNWNHPNFRWSNNQNTMQQSFQQFGNKQFNPHGFQQQFPPRQQFQPMGMQHQTHGGAGQSSNKKFEFEELRLMCKNQALICQSQAISIKTLENQIGQIANALLNRPPGMLPSDTETNPGKREVEEQVNAITLRSGKVASPQIQQDKEPEKSQVSENAVVAEEDGAEGSRGVTKEDYCGTHSS